MKTVRFELNSLRRISDRLSRAVEDCITEFVEHANIHRFASQCVLQHDRGNIMGQRKGRSVELPERLVKYNISLADAIPNFGS